MRTLKKLIASHQRELRKHGLFELIEVSHSTDPIAHMARALAWWPMVFQDILRLNLERVRGSGLERFVECHLHEDAGHDRWFLQDLSALGVAPPTLDELFGVEFQPIRDACYSLVAEVQRPQSGVQRVARLLAMEATGHVFFEEVCSTVDRVCPELPLRYFARSHLHVEKSHDLFSQSTETEVDMIVLDDEERVRSEESVAHIYGTFTHVFSFLADRVRDGMRSRSNVRELGPPSPTAPLVRNAGGS